jgi:hypothetical protein
VEPEDAHQPDQPVPPPRRPPRSFAVHWAIDSAVALLVALFPALLLGINLLPVALVAAVIGLIAAPTTLRREAEALARRPPPEERLD